MKEIPCKQCDGRVGSELHNYRSEHESYMGDHAERRDTDAGVFCSARCLIAYLSVTPND